jgi:membrane protease YdiL (CAAX protease family)
MSAWFEILSVTGLVFSYIWWWQGVFAGDFLVCVGIVLGITLSGHRRRGESARDLGFRCDNFKRSFREVFSIVGPLLLGMAILGLAMGWNREPPIDRLMTRVTLMPLFGIVQEYVLMGFYYRRFNEALPGVVLPAVASATVFALLHLPNAPLVLMSFVVALGACWFYRKTPNLWVLGLAHGLLSITVAMLLAKLLVFGLKVGPRALR